MKTVQICLNSIDKVKSFVNDITKFDYDFDFLYKEYKIKKPTEKWSELNGVHFKSRFFYLYKLIVLLNYFTTIGVNCFTLCYVIGKFNNAKISPAFSNYIFFMYSSAMLIAFSTVTFAGPPITVLPFTQVSILIAS